MWLVADGGDRRLDRILEGVARPRCRRVLYCLAEDEPLSLDEVTARIAEHETGPNPATEQHGAVKTDLYHHVLPKLADLKLIEYDLRSETVRFQDPPSELEEFLRLCRQLDTEL